MIHISFTIIGVLVITVLAVSLLIMVTLYLKLKNNSEQLRLQASIGQRMKRSFLANMSHEVRTPLNGMIGSAQMLEGTALSLRQKKYLGNIIHGGEGLLQMFDDIIFIVQLDQGEYIIESREEWLSKWLERILVNGRFFLKDKELGLSILIRPLGQYLLKGPFDALQKILFHLVINAYKFTSKGEIFLEVDLTDQNTLSICLHDSGIGISKEALDQIFDDFWQEREYSDKNSQGAGIGLGLVKRLCNVIGAELKVDSEKDQGTRFSINVPIEVVKRDEVMIPSSFSGINVSIINSFFMERQALAYVLAQSNCEIIYNGDIPEKWDDILAKSERIIISGEMLYQRGDWVNSNVTHFKGHESKVTVVHTIHSDLSLVRKFARMGFVRYLQRPFSAQSLVECESIYDERFVEGSRYKVLLIDDEPDFLILLEEAIGEQIDAEIFKATGGQEGFDLLTTRNIDLIVLDIEMKGIGGVEFFNRMQAMGIDLPVLFLSAHYLDEDLLNNVDGRFIYRDKYSGMEQIVSSINTLLLDRGEERKPEVQKELDLPKILVVDDSDVNTTLIEMMLSEYPCKLFFAFNGREAVDLYKKEKADIVLMDLQMPVMDGFEAMGQIRMWEKNEQYRACHIFALSAYSADEEINKAKEAGANDYLVKPIKRNVLFDALDKLKSK